VAIKLAQEFDGEIISADSRQIYCGMEIGSGKITLDEEKMAPHYMLGIISPRTDFNVAKFKKKAERHIQDILKRNKLPIICGGTGFWIQSIVDDVTYPQVKPDWKLREKLEKHSLEELLEKLKKLDPTRAKTVDIQNKVRLIRAIEICQALGKVPESKTNINLKYNFLQIGIKRDKEILHQRIKLNIAQRFKKGMITEVEKMHSTGLSWKKIMSFGLSYKLIPMYLKEEIKTKEELLEKIYLAEKNYAKRQLTWFQRDKRILWLENYADIQKEVIKFIKK